jgi:hypothetical protein
LFSPKAHGKPGPKGPSPEVISAIVEMKRRNPGFGYQRITDQIALAFEVGIDKDVVRRVLITIDQNQTREAHHGLRFLATVRTVYRASICFAAKRS